MNCKLIGNVFQALEATLNQSEYFYAEKRALIYMDSGIDQEVLMSGNGLANVISNKLSGESLFLLKYIKVNPKHTLILRRGDYVASNNRVQIDLNFSINKLLTGARFTYQKLTGDSTVFFDCIDSLIERVIAADEEIVVDEDHIKALYDIDDSKISVQRNINIVRNMVSGEGFLMTKITGPGKVFLSSVPIIR